MFVRELKGRQLTPLTEPFQLFLQLPSLTRHCQTNMYMKYKNVAFENKSDPQMTCAYKTGRNWGSYPYLHVLL